MPVILILVAIWFFWPASEKPSSRFDSNHIEDKIADCFADAKADLGIAWDAAPHDYYSNRNPRITRYVNNCIR
jgi:hypothetical protein